MLILPNLNPLFSEAEGNINLVEYLKPGHILGTFIDDIAKWILKEFAI